MERTDELKERIRQQPLNDRLEESRRRIGDMCSKGRCPKMTIPVQHDDDDFYINTTLADAQATIAALQARVQKLEARQHFGACAKCLTNAWRICKEGTPDAVEMKCSNGSTWWLCDYCLSKEQLTQRTAELEAIEKILDINSGKTTVEKVRDLHHSFKQVWESYQDASNEMFKAQAELERVRGELAETKEVEAALSSKVAEYEVELNGDPQNFYGRGRTVGLRTLVLALPKVEYEIKASNFIAHIWPDHDTEEPLVDLRASVAALLKHRQGMEG